MILKSFSEIYSLINRHKTNLLQLNNDSALLEKKIQKYNNKINYLNDVRSHLLSTELNLKSSLSLIEEEIDKIDLINKKMLEFDLVAIEKKSFKEENINKLITEVSYIADYVKTNENIIRRDRKSILVITFIIIFVSLFSLIILTLKDI
jgi:hypothetical protein